MAGFRKAATGLATEFIGTATQKSTQKGLSASGRQFSKEAIDTILSSKGVSVLGENKFFSQPGLEIPTKDLHAVKHLAETGDSRFADYKNAYDNSITPVMINIADEVNTEIAEKAQKAQIQRATQPQVEKQFPDDQFEAENWVKVGGIRDQNISKMLKGGNLEDLIAKTDAIKTQMAELDKADPAFKKLKNKLKGLQSKKDEVYSMMATGWKGNVTYKKKGAAPDARTRDLEDAEGWKANYDKSLLFHHNNMKDVDATAHIAMATLREAGAATDQDIIDLYRILESYGFAGGSVEEAATRMHTATHDYLHKKIMLTWHDGMSNIQPDHSPWRGGPLRGKPKSFDVPQLEGSDTKAIWKMMKDAGVVTKADVDYVLTWSKVAEGKQGPIDLQKGLKKFKEAQKKGGIPQADNKSELQLLREQFKNAKNPEEIKQLYKEFIEGVTVPMTDEAQLLERTARNQLTPQQLLEKDPDVISAAREKQLELETDEYGQPKPQEVTW